MSSSTENKRLFAIRGAVCSKNTKEDICKNTVEVCNEIFQKNNVKSEDLVSIQFTMTSDLTKLNPATALRIGGACIDTSKVALFCSQEPVIEGMLPETIRVMVSLYLDENARIINVYLNGAEKLRPDFVQQ